MAETRLEIPTLDELRANYCNDVKRGKIRAGVTNPNVAAGSETYLRGEATASAALQICAREVALQDATMPDKATGDDLIRLAKVQRNIDPSAGAGATGNVIASCTGIVTYVAGQQGTTSDGLRYEVVTTTLAVAGTLIPVRGVDVGKRTNKPAGTSLTWTSPPVGSSSTALVDSSGLTAGADADNDARLRQRFQDAIRHPASSGSWAHFVKWAEEASAGVEKAFCYCAPQGPGTVHVAYSVEPTADNAYSREGSSALTNTVANNVVANCPEHADITTTTVDDYPTNVMLKLTLPAHIIDGGPGSPTWLDPIATRWPPSYPSGGVWVSTVTSNTRLRITTVGTAPVTASHSRIAVWSHTTKEFLHAQVKAVTTIGGGVYELELYQAIDSSAVTVGDFMSPDAENLDDYGVTLAECFKGLGPGELTASALVLPRALRHPLNTESWNASLTSKHIGQISTNHEEISHVTVSLPASLPSTPPLPAAVTDPPKILVLGHLGLYPV